MSLYNSSQVRIAMVRPLPTTFEAALTQHPPEEPLNVDLAREQHENYTEVLRGLVRKVLVVPSDEASPDCCFIEDTAIVLGSTVIMTLMGADSRRDEMGPVLKIFQQIVAAGVRLRIHLLQEPATLDGGDVLQMGNKLFVGLSERSNEAALVQLRKIVDMPVVSVPVVGGLHLKSVLSAIDDKTLVVADSPEARAMGEKIVGALPGSRMIAVPDTVCANVVRLGTSLLVQAGFPQSEEILGEKCRELGLKMVPVCMSELIKADGALTCCSIIMP